MCSSITAAPTTEETSTTTISSTFEDIHTTTTPFYDIRVNEVDGKSPNDELFATSRTTTKLIETTEQEVPVTTESVFDKRFDGVAENEDGFESWKKSLIHEVEKSAETTTLSTLSSIAPQHPSISEHTRDRIMQHYRELMRSQFLRTLLIMLSEVKKRQMQHQQQQDVQESQVVETSVPYHSGSECECEIDDVSTSDDGKVIVFDENTRKYVYVDGKTLAEKIQQRHAHHVSVIRMFEKRKCEN